MEGGSVCTGEHGCPFAKVTGAQELAAAFMAASILSGANFDVRPAEMDKEVPGGVFSM